MPPFKKLTPQAKRRNSISKPRRRGVETVYCTPWFSLQKIHLRTTNPHLTPYFRLKNSHGVCVFAITEKKELILVRQFRPAINKWTYEVPAGGVEKFQTPLEAAKQELWEETGFVASSWKSLGSGRVMMDRAYGRLYGWLALGARMQGASKPTSRALIKKIKTKSFFAWVKNKRFEQVDGLGFLLIGLVRYPKILTQLFNL